MKVAVIQIRGDQGLDGNLAACGRWLGEAAAAGARLAVLPENFAYYGCRDLPAAGVAEATPEGPARRFLGAEARRHGLWLLGGTLPIAAADDPRPFAASLLVSPEGEEVARYDKIHLFDVDVVETGRQYRESADYRPGGRVVVADTPLGRLGLSVCYDLRFPELYRQLAAQGAEIIVAPSAFTYTTGTAHWHILVRARAVENLATVIAPNQAGHHASGRRTYGHSLICGPWGQVQAEARSEANEVVIADIDRTRAAQLREGFPCLTHRRLA